MVTKHFSRINNIHHKIFINVIRFLERRLLGRDCFLLNVKFTTTTQQTV